MAQLKKASPKKLREWADKRASAIWTNLLTNHLWQRMVKNTLATTICVILAVTPAVVHIFGTAAYLAPITTVFGHPGRRFGQMAEALLLVVCGALLGTAWSTLGIYLSSLVFMYNESAAYTIKGLFLAVALLFHGFLRSHTPRLFIFVVLLVIVAVVSLTGVSRQVSTILVTTLLYPILIAVGVLLLVNCFVFPEFSSSFLGITTIETLGETVGVLRDAGTYFVAIANEDSIPEQNLDDEGDTEILQEAKTAAEKPERNKPSSQSNFQRLWDRVSGGKKAKKANAPIPARPSKLLKLQDLTSKKTKLREKLAVCKAVQQECNFELAWSVLPPRDLKAISDTAMKKLVANTIALIGVCESKYALVGDLEEPEGKKAREKSSLSNSINPNTPNVENPLSTSAFSNSTASKDPNRRPSTPKKKSPPDEKQKTNTSKGHLAREKEALELVKPKKEIESGDSELLKYLVSHIAQSLCDLQKNIDRSINVVTSSLAYCYDVKKLPSGAFPPKGIRLEEIDIQVDVLTDALKVFDLDSAAALENAAAIHDGLDGAQVDIMPRMETFLISSFLLNLRQAALHTSEMLKHSRLIVEKRQERHDRRRIYVPNINWSKWLSSGGEEDMLALPARGKKGARTGTGNNNAADDDEISSKGSLLKQNSAESGLKITSDERSAKTTRNLARKTMNPKDKKSAPRGLRSTLADILEYVAESEDVTYAIKLAVATFLVSFPAFVAKWSSWYRLNRGLWAALQLILVTEVAIGTSIWTFFIRAVGTTIGCLWGYAAYEIARGNRVVCVVMIVIGIIPSTYVQLGSKFVKAGMVSIISMCVVALGTLDPSVPGTATENFLRRLIAFLIGGLVALAVEVLLFPVRARDRLVESLATSIKNISEMEACLAYGVESESNVCNVQSIEVSSRFDEAQAKAQGALAAAETFLPFCGQEPRLKGSFEGLALIYTEILYVLHSIVDRMDNMLHLRYAYGSGVLEEFNGQIYRYRRDLAGSITLVLFAVHEGLTTKLPLPQFLPSPRLAHLRMVNRVRQIMRELVDDDTEVLREGHDSIEGHLEANMVKRLVRQKFLAWNAAAGGGTIEVIEFLEELIELVKLLVGADEFRSGMLTRPTYRAYNQRISEGGEDVQRKHTESDGRDDGGENVIGDDEMEEQHDIMPDIDVKKDTRSKRRLMLSKTQEEMENKMRLAPQRNSSNSKQHEVTDEGIPRSLQRVRSRRLEELSLQKSRSVDVEKRRSN